MLQTSCKNNVKKNWRGYVIVATKKWPGKRAFSWWGPLEMGHIAVRRPTLEPRGEFSHVCGFCSLFWKCLWLLLPIVPRWYTRILLPNLSQLHFFFLFREQSSCYHHVCMICFVTFSCTNYSYYCNLHNFYFRKLLLQLSWRMLLAKLINTITENWNSIIRLGVPRKFRKSQIQLEPMN